MPEKPILQSRQFRTLYRVFLLRVVDLELLSADGDPTRLLGQFAALFAAISFLFCTPLILASGKLDESTLGSFEHALIAITMLVVGLLSALNWDSIFPDKRDVFVLAPLPVNPRTIFAAKLAAMAYALGLSVLTLNVFTGLIWPLYFCSTATLWGILRSFAAYWATIFAAAAFMFFFVLTLQGVASQLLPRQLFLRFSAWLQMGTFCLFLGMYILEPSLETPKAFAAAENQYLLAWLPSYWFYALFHQLDGATEHIQPVFAALAARAWIALAVVISGAAITLLLSYLRSLHKIAEEPDILPNRSPRNWKHTLLAGKSLSHTITLFCLRTLLRSRQHRVLLSFYFGVGLAIVLAYIKTLILMESSAPRAAGTSASAIVGTPFIEASILMLCVALAGIRIVATLPITLHANWLFRITELHMPPVYNAAVRHALLVVGLAPMWLGSCLLFLCLWPWCSAIEHLLVLGLLGMILVEVCLQDFPKVPFTCSYLPGKGNLQFVFWGFALILLPLIHAAAQAELRALNNVTGFGAMVAALSLVLGCVRWVTQTRAQRLSHMQFEEAYAPEIYALDLHTTRHEG
jgi:hypothetical protein